MAKRKYAKENNLVKAINTDSLELQKPLVNEYYDINVHNSNMDKIDLAIKQNKNNISENKTSILSIKNLENEEVEVRKIETEENFIEVEDTKNGYFTDIKLEGKTLVVNENNEVVEAGTSGATIKSVGQDVNEISVLSGLPNTKKIIVTNFEVGNINGNDGSDLQNSTLARSVDYIPTNNCSFVLAKWRLGLDKLVCYDENKNVLQKAYIVILKEGDICHIILNDNVEYIRVVVNINSSTNSSNVKCEVSLLDSQDKKRILYYNSDTKAWEKPVLRKWDTIEKHSDGKYYYHKRSGEIVLDIDSNDINWIDNGSYDGNNLMLFAIDMKDVNWKKHDSYQNSFICDKFVTKIYKEVVPSNVLVEGMSSEGTFENIYCKISKSKLSQQNKEGFKQWLQDNPTTIVYQLAEEKVYECTNLDLISYQDETNYIVNSGAIVPKSSFNVNDGVSDVVKLLQQRTALDGIHEHNYRKYKLTTDSGELHHISTDLNKCTKTGFYSVELGTLNSPSSSNFWFLEVYGNADRFIKQVATRYASDVVETYIRTCANYYWNSWKKVTTTSTLSELNIEEEILALQEENKELKEELAQIQASIASLTSLMATTLEEK